jgi:hypothetical protein
VISRQHFEYVEFLPRTILKKYDRSGRRSPFGYYVTNQRQKMAQTTVVDKLSTLHTRRAQNNYISTELPRGVSSKA